MRTSVQNVIAWIDANTAAMAAEEVALAEAAGRVTAQQILAASAVPPFDRAATDGLAVKASETLGASSYNPLSFRLASAQESLMALAAVRVNAGDRLPGGADAILPLDHVSLDAAAGRCEIIEPAVFGSLIERAGSHAALGATLLAPGRRLGPPEIGLLAAAQVKHLPVIRRPQVRVLLAGRDLGQPDTPPADRPPASRMIGEVDGPLLCALIERDGGVVAELRRIERDRESLCAALALPGADIVLLAGGTGAGVDDFAQARPLSRALGRAAPPARQTAHRPKDSRQERRSSSCRAAIHGVALHPGESAGMGRLGTGACMGKISVIPMLETILRSRRISRDRKGSAGFRPAGQGQARPIASFAEAGLMATVRADGFVILPEGSEGLAAGTAVTVYLFHRP